MTNVGGVCWQKLELSYDGEKPEEDIPRWMTDVHEVWYRDPKLVVEMMLENPDFDGVMDYAPLQELDGKGQIRLKNMMSGSWAWDQAVRDTSAS